jgi:hypothetical protein
MTTHFYHDTQMALDEGSTNGETNWETIGHFQLNAEPLHLCTVLSIYDRDRTWSIVASGYQFEFVSHANVGRY